MIKRTYPQSRLRRTRSKGFLRDLVAENHLSTNDLIQPIFIADQSELKVEIPSMPGIFRHNLESLYVETEELVKKGIKSVAAEGFTAPGVVVSYTQDSEIQNGSKFAEKGMQIAAGVPLACDEPEDFKTFRLGLFGLDKLYNVEATFKRLTMVLDQVL